MKVITEKRFRTGLGEMHKIIMPESKCHLFDMQSGLALRVEAHHVNA